MTKRIIITIIVLAVTASGHMANAAGQRGFTKDKQKQAKWRLPGKRMTSEQKRALKNYGDDVFIEFDKQEIPSSLVGPLSSRVNESDPVADAEAALVAHGSAFRRGPDDSFDFESIAEDRQGNSHVRMRQKYKGLPVIDGALTVRLTKDHVTGIYGRFVADLDVAVQPIITGEQAATSAQSFIQGEGASKARVVEKREPIIFVDEAGFGSLAIPIQVSYETAGAGKSEDLFVDAHDGAILGRDAVAQKAIEAAACCPPPNFLKNPGFELGNDGSWRQSSGIIWPGGRVPPRTGGWEAWFCGYGVTHQDLLSQDIFIPANATSATLSFWINIRTDERSTYPYDTFKVLLAIGGGHAELLVEYSNANPTSGYILKSINVTDFRGCAVTILFQGQEDVSLATDFVIDDTKLTWATPIILP